MRLVRDDNDAYENAEAVDTNVDADSVTTDSATDQWPAEVDMILSAMEAAREARGDRRGARRKPHRTRAELNLFAHAPLLPPIILYTRDVTSRGVGFITRERVPLGYSGLIELNTPAGETIITQGMVYRCREAVNGWFEGSLRFSSEQAI